MKVLLKFVVTLLVLALVAGGVWWINDRVTYRTQNHAVKEGRSRLEQMDKTSVDEAQKQVEAAWATATPSAAPQQTSEVIPGLYQKGTTYSPQGVRQDEECTMWVKHPKSTGKLKKLLENSVILGDSMVEAINDFSILYPDEIVYLRGVSVVNAGDLVDKTIRLKPQRIFTVFGLNDMTHYQKKVGQFGRDYYKMLQKLQKQIPGVELYVCAITPVQQSAISKDGSLARVDRYNRELIRMCQKYQIPFVNSTPILTGHDELYEPDGIHPTYAYYPKWLTLLAQKAGLL